MKALLVAVVVAVLVGGGLAVAYLAPEPGYGDEELRAFGFTAFPEPRAIPAFDLDDAGGGRFSPERLRGRWSLIFFGYANCPDICPLTMAELGNAERLLRDAGDEIFQGVLVTVDPERDTADLLAKYVAAFSERFVGVTGTPAAIEAFARTMHVGFAKVPAAPSEIGYLVDHASHVAVVDPQGRHYGFVRGPLDAQHVATLTRALAQRLPPRTSSQG